MKITSYNLMSGGFNSYNSIDESPQRINLIRDAIKKSDADFVSLIDTFRWDQIYSVSRLRSMFNYPYVYFINLEDERVKQVRSLLKKIGVRKHPIIMGDLNTFSPRDIPVVTLSIKSFLKRNQDLTPKFAPVLNEMQKAQVVKILEDA